MTLVCWRVIKPELIIIIYVFGVYADSKAQIRLCICAVWSGSLLSPDRGMVEYKDLQKCPWSDHM